MTLPRSSDVHTRLHRFLIDQNLSQVWGSTGKAVFNSDFVCVGAWLTGAGGGGNEAVAESQTMRPSNHMHIDV